VAELRIAVFGTPGPQGSKRHVGHGQMVESSKKVGPWREAVVAAVLGEIRCCKDPDCCELRHPFPLDGPLVARFVFTLRKPTSAPKTRRTWPDRYPDASKLLRATEDALVQAGAVRDDARLVEYTRLAKVYPGEDPEALAAPGALIAIRPLVEATDCAVTW
jgi:Holliday junction resolvase RusA-like endonuclease